MRARGRTTIVLGAIALSGCLATKNDIALLQSELRATRAASTASDDARRRQADSIARATGTTTNAAIARLEAMLRSQGDSIRVMKATVERMRLATQEKLNELSDEVSRVGAVTGNLSPAYRQMREQLETTMTALNQIEALLRDLQRSGIVSLPPGGIGGGAPPDSTAPGSSIPNPPTGARPGTPGPAALMNDARRSLTSKACVSGRNSLKDLLENYPADPLASEAMYYIADSYVTCESTPKRREADSVFREVVDRFPKSEHAGLSLYRRGVLLKADNRAAESRTLFERVMRDFPGSQAARLSCVELGRPNCR